MKTIRFTKEGYENLQKEQKELLEKRKPAVEDLKKSRELGDLKENGYYQASRAKLNSIDNRLMRIKYYLKQAEIITGSDSNTVGVGSIVTILNGAKETTYQITGDLEANPGQGKISLLSPLGKALAGKKLNDEIAIKTPKGELRSKIIKLSS